MLRFIKGALPFVVGVAVLWFGLDASSRVYDAYEVFCFTGSNPGCRNIYTDLELLRYAVAVAAFASGYAISKFQRMSERNKAVTRWLSERDNP